jgi:hypothetical protein
MADALQLHATRLPAHSAAAFTVPEAACMRVQHMAHLTHTENRTARCGACGRYFSATANTADTYSQSQIRPLLRRDCDYSVHAAPRRSRGSHACTLHAPCMRPRTSRAAMHARCSRLAAPALRRRLGLTAALHTTADRLCCWSAPQTLTLCMSTGRLAHAETRRGGPVLVR